MLKFLLTLLNVAACNILNNRPTQFREKTSAINGHNRKFIARLSVCIYNSCVDSSTDYRYVYMVHQVRHNFTTLLDCLYDIEMLYMTLLFVHLISGLIWVLRHSTCMIYCDRVAQYRSLIVTIYTIIKLPIPIFIGETIIGNPQKVIVEPPIH